MSGFSWRKFAVTALSSLAFAGLMFSVVSCAGEDGSPGINGADGADGAKVEICKDENGDENGNWCIDGVDTGIKAEGTDGADGANGADGADGTPGTNGTNGINGAPGAGCT